MTSKERVLKTVRGERVDRVPIYAPCVTGRLINPAGVPTTMQVAHLLIDGVSDLDEWIINDSRYREIMQLAWEKCERVWTYEFSEFDRRFFLIPKEFIKVAKVERINDTLLIKYQVRTPKGDLEYICSKRKNISTVWDKKPLIEDKKDVEKILCVPYKFQKPDIDDFFKYKNKIEEQGGLMYILVSTPLVCVAQLFSFEKFLTWCITEKSVIIKLIETVFERIYELLEYVLQKGVGPIFHFAGSERATPPMMSPELYDEFVVKYDSKLFDLVHRYGNLVAVHCHGRVKSVLSKLVASGVDLLDPVEAPPGGDIEIGEAKRKVEGKMTLVGNIQFGDMETCTPDQIDKKVKDVIFWSGKKKFVLATTEGPISPVSLRMRDNYIQFIESGLKYGKM